MSEFQGHRGENVFRNVELLRQIFELLEYEHQLKLACVCRHFYHFFREFICTEKHREVFLNKHQEFVLIKTDQFKNELKLSSEGLLYFLDVYAEDIEELREFRGLATDTQRFENLTAISYYRMIITNRHLEILVEDCPKLQMLRICECCSDKYEIIHIGKDLNLMILLKMRMLQEFVLRNDLPLQAKSNSLHDIITRLKSQYRSIKSILNPMEHELNLYSYETMPNSPLKTLDIYGKFRTLFWAWNLETYLNKFENLLDLTITLWDIVKDDVLLSLAYSCQKLNKLSFEFTTFENIQKFAVLKSLTDLSFRWCNGLSYDNLKEILSEMSLEKFSSEYTKYYGLFQYYFVSPTLKSIHVDAFHSFEFRSQ